MKNFVYVDQKIVIILNVVLELILNYLNFIQVVSPIEICLWFANPLKVYKKVLISQHINK